MRRREAGENEVTKKARVARWEGEREEAPAFPSSHRPPRAFYFSIIAECIFIRISIESLCRGAESSGSFVPGKIKHFERLGCFARCFGFGVGFDNVCLFAFLVSYIVDNHCILYF